MTTDRITDSDGELLNVLQELGPLAWRKYHARYPELLVRGRIQRFDQSKSPPSFAFRFEDEREDGIEVLLRAVERYHGELHWTMYGRKRQGLPGTNWVICPTRVLNVIEVALEQGLTPDQYLARHEPQFAAVAYDDLVGLIERIRHAIRGLLGNTE